MSSRIEHAKKELETINGLQKFMSSTSVSEDEVVEAMLSDGGFRHLSRFNIFRQKMELRNVGDDIEFNIPSNIHQLNQVNFIQKLPCVALAPEYREDHRIAWIPKTLLYIIGSAQMVKGDGTEIGARLTDRGLDIWVEYFAKEFFQNDYETLLDLIQGETNWSDELPAKTLSLSQPFFYTTTGTFFKRCLVEKQNITHNYRCCLDIRKLLLLEKRVNGVWERCTNGDDILKKCLFSNLTADGILNRPELYGTCVIANEIEYREIKDSSLTHNYLAHAQELIYVSVDKILTNEGTEKVVLAQSGCVRGIYWFIENLNASERGDHYNYATEEGECPIISTSLYHLDRCVWEFDSHHHRSIFPSEVKLRTPRKMGYHYHPFSAHGSLKITDTNVDLLTLSSSLNVRYNMGPNTRGRLHVFLDMHRVVSYEEGDIRVLRDETPVSVTAATAQPPQHQMMPPRPNVVLPQRHR